MDEERLKTEKMERAFAPRAYETRELNEREMSETERLDSAFTYHSPNEYTEPAYAAIRAAGKALALVILNTTPKCADRTAAIRKVREAVMTANAAIALKGLI